MERINPSLYKEYIMREISLYKDIQRLTKSHVWEAVMGLGLGPVNMQSCYLLHSPSN